MKLRVIFTSILLGFYCISCTKQSTTEKPNVVIFFLDDAGFADFNPFIDPNNVIAETPHVNKLALEGVTYTNFHVPQAICSASRAALLTGSYPGRTKVFGAHPPKAKGLDTIYPTMAEIFKQNGYTTGIFGKWHLGDQEGTRSHDRGFDYSAGLMYSNDMWEHHPENPRYWGKFPLQYWKNGKVTIEKVTGVHQKQLTQWATQESVDFIKNQKEEPFLLYVPYSMPHVPLYVSNDFEGISGKGLYYDVISEIDWSIGQITATLKENNLDENTIVIFTSDNGPWAVYGNHAGKTPYRSYKGTSFEGGTRSACIIKYPLQLKGNTQSNKLFNSIDLLPTLSALANINLEHEIDGKNVWPYLNETSTNVPHTYYAYSNVANLEAIATGDGKWKLHLEHNYIELDSIGADGLPGKYIDLKQPLALYDMENDPLESKNVIESNPEIAETLIDYAKKHHEKFYNTTP